MSKSNGYSLVSQRAIERIRQISEDALSAGISDQAKDRQIEELDFHKGTLERAFKFRQTDGPKLGVADSIDYFDEKLSGLISFAKMAVDAAQRDGDEPNQIIENVSHYSYLVSDLVVAKWVSKAARPVSDHAIKDSSYENRDAMHRLVNR